MGGERGDLGHRGAGCPWLTRRLQSEVLELQASPKGAARGTVVEARKEPGRGVVFSMLVERGTLNPGDIISTGTPAGVGVFRDPPVTLKAGDVVACEIEKIGEIRNTCVETAG